MRLTVKAIEAIKEALAFWRESFATKRLYEEALAQAATRVSRNVTTVGVVGPVSGFGDALSDRFSFVRGNGQELLRIDNGGTWTIGQSILSTGEPTGPPPRPPITEQPRAAKVEPSSDSAPGDRAIRLRPRSDVEP